MNPVDAADEDFSVSLGADALKSKFVIDDGKYGARCTDLSKAVSKAGNEMYVFDFLGTSGEADGLEFKARVLTEEKYQWKLVKILAAFGIKPVPRLDPQGNPVLDKKGKPAFDLPIKKGAIVGKGVTLELAVQEFGDGKQSMSVEEVLPAEEGATTGGPSNDIPF